jgi:hypothetical protein
MTPSACASGVGRVDELIRVQNNLVSRARRDCAARRDEQNDERVVVVLRRQTRRRARAAVRPRADAMAEASPRAEEMGDDEHYVLTPTDAEDLLARRPIARASHPRPRARSRSDRVRSTSSRRASRHDRAPTATVDPTSNLARRDE